MNGKLAPHRVKNPRWCDQCKHPSIGRFSPARWIWMRPAAPNIYLCTLHAEEVRQVLGE